VAEQRLGAPFQRESPRDLVQTHDLLDLASERSDLASCPKQPSHGDRQLFRDDRLAHDRVGLDQ